MRRIKSVSSYGRVAISQIKMEFYATPFFGGFQPHPYGKNKTFQIYFREQTNTNVYKRECLI
jgi:hypothetical protein